jgi:hypothetical protein
MAVGPTVERLWAIGIAFLALSCSSTQARLYEAAERGDAVELRGQLATGADPNQAVANGWTPLMIAAAEGHPDCVDALLAAGAEPNARNAPGRTALMFAAKYGYSGVVKELLRAGADASLQPTDDEGTPAIVIAADGGHVDTVAVLLRHGVDGDAAKKQGETALIAASKGHAEVVKALLSAGANVDARNDEGWTALVHLKKDPSATESLTISISGSNEPAKASARSRLRYRTIRVEQLLVQRFRQQPVFRKHSIDNSPPSCREKTQST